MYLLLTVALTGKLFEAMVNVLLLVMPIIFTANEDDQDMCVVFSFCFNVTSIQYLDQFRIIS